jgi:hypothetical protein
MLKMMTARYPGKCSRTGAPIYPGDSIAYDTGTRRAWLPEHDDISPPPPQNYVSHVFNFSGREYYRNKAGRCEDAPCCGCCTI